MKPNRITIRKAEAADLPALRDAHRASILEIGPAFYPPEVMAAWGRERSLEGYVEAVKNGETYFIAENAEQPGFVLGFSSHQFEDNRHHLKALYVRGTAARQGLGGKLLNVVEDFTRAQGGTVLHLEASLPGEAFYKAKGFKELSRYEHAMGGEAIIMEKNLS